MDLSNAEKALRQTAAAEGISVEALKKEIEDAISAAYANPDPAVRDIWRFVPCKGERPTPEEAIQYISNILVKDD